ncbi:hypothetical protein [Wenzhouxiangella sp. EGI_FJ10409]|uniref:hypothetical protein n=1 Tax=Wenzhouxiangella sp. EGI_FJ10409 TaxID=3243767 RepID=UPI0035D5F837
MALINCPGCGRRISDKSVFCAHCELPLGEMSNEDVSRLKRRRWRRHVWQAKNITYVAMTALVGGMLWWFLVEPQGWVLPPPILPIGLIILGAVGYLVGRVRLFWLQLKRNRPQ